MSDHPRSTVAATLWSVQWMRAAAALMVVVGHGQSVVAAIVTAQDGHFARSTLLPWGAGVDLFFVISGFIMVHASRRLFGAPGAPGEFLRRRLARIVPLYWLTTTLFLLILAAATLKGGDPFPSLPAIVASYLFLPHGGTGDGLAFPVFDLGWTLNYEMFFYALFALVLTLRQPRTRTIPILIALLFGLVLAGGLVPAGWTAALYWTRPIVIDFALGLGIGLALAEGVVLPPAPRWMLVIAGIALLVADPFGVFSGPVGTTVANGWPRVLLAGIPAAAALAGAVLGPEPPAHRLLAPFAALGDASYSLYLLHPFALITTEKLAQKSVAFRALPPGLLVAGTVVAAIAIAIAAHALLERPMTRAVAARLHRRNPPPLPQPLPHARGAET